MNLLTPRKATGSAGWGVGLHLVEQGAELVAGERKGGAVGVLGVADRHHAGQPGHLDALTARVAAVAALAPDSGDLDALTAGVGAVAALAPPRDRQIRRIHGLSNIAQSKSRDWSAEIAAPRIRS